MIADRTGYRRSELRPETDLFQDLGVDGDDALDLLIRLRDDFAINMDEVQFKRHFLVGATSLQSMAIVFPAPAEAMAVAALATRAPTDNDCRPRSGCPYSHLANWI